MAMSDHVPFYSSYETFVGSAGEHPNAYDVHHINSIDKDRSGDFHLSVHHTHLVASINGKTSDIIGTLSGKLTDFTDASGGRATDFAW